MPQSFYRTFALGAWLGCLAMAQTQTNAPAAPKIVVALVGDSTQTENAGYGPGFCANLTADAVCLNRAQGGASTKTYRADGLWDKALETHPDWMLIQFGHNDLETPEHVARQTDLKTEYPANLRRFVQEARARGIQPILVTPIARRFFGPDGKVHSDLLAHADAMKKVAAEEHVPLLDLHRLSIDYLERIGEAEGNQLGLTKKDAQGNTVPDKTHLNYRGSYVFGRIAAEGMAAAVPELARYVKPQAAVLPPEGERSVAILHGAAVKIVLVGDSTVATGGGWGPAFCALLTPNVACVNKARGGRSSKSYYDEGLWKPALAERGDYYLIQFGHNDMPGKGPERETDPETTYAANLRRYIAEARAQGGRAVIVTSLSRRNYRDGKLVTDLTAYAAAARRVAREEKVPLVDLNAMSTRLLSGMTQEEADRFDATAHPDAKAEAAATAAVPTAPDRTHLNELGARVFARMVADGLIHICVELGPDVKGEAAPPAGRGR